MYEDTTGQNTTTHHHSPPLLSAHNPNALLSLQQQQQTAAQSSHTPQQSSLPNGPHTNGTVASAQSQQIVTPSAASDSPVSPPTGKFHGRKATLLFLRLRLHNSKCTNGCPQGPLHIPAIPAAKRSGYEDASLLRQPWGYEPPFDAYNYTPGYPYSIERDRKVFYPSYPDQAYAQVSAALLSSKYYVVTKGGLLRLNRIFITTQYFDAP